MRKKFLAFSGLGVLLALVIVSGIQREPASSVKPVVIEKIYFMIHPLLYRAPYAKAGDPEGAERYQQYADYEKKVSSRWFQAIANMGPKEALVIGAPNCPKDLEESVEKYLGPRGLVIKDDLISQPELWQRLSPEAKADLGRDLLAMFWKHGFAWTSDPLGQPVIARGWAERVKEAFKQRGLTFDPGTVKAEGWGESFEGCVANYSRYMGSYLGLANPIEDNFEMTVPDAPFLLTARFLERVALGRNVRLYFWEAKDGRLIALFQNAQAAIGDPSLYAQFPLQGMSMEVRSRMDRPMWPKNLPPEKGSAAEAMALRLKKKETPAWELKRQEKGSTIVAVNGHLKVPIPTPWIPDVAYIFARGAALTDFRNVLANARLVEETKNQD
jgi:hypothetical protein